MKSARVTIGQQLGDRGPLTVDIARLIETRFMIQANAGGGKSYLIRKLVEQIYGKVQVVILDIEGEFSTLREKFDFILAGKGGDIPTHPKTAAMLAAKCMEHEFSLIADLYELKKHERMDFVRNFLTAMLEVPKELYHPVVIILDEAHYFAPEKIESAAAEAVVDVGARGRKRGICLGLATQRISKINKDVAAECLNKFIGRTSLDIDRKRAGDELGFVGQKDSLTLRNLKPGQFYSFGPAVGEDVQLMQVDQVETTHPRAGQRLGHRVTKPTEHVKKVLAKLTDLPRQAEEELRDRTQMQTRIRELERELREAKKAVKVETKIEKVLDEKTVERAVRATKKEIAKHVLKLNYSLLQAIGPVVDETIKKCTAVLEVPNEPAPPLPTRPAAPTPKAPRPVANGTSDGESRLGAGEKKILKFLAVREGKAFNKAQIGALTGFAPTSGTFGTYLSRLKTAGLVEQAGQGQFRLADPARAQELLGADYHAPDRSALEDWVNQLGGGARRIYEVVLQGAGREFTKAELAAEVGMEPTSGTYGTYLSRLSTLGLIERGRDSVRLNPELLGI